MDIEKRLAKIKRIFVRITDLAAYMLRELALLFFGIYGLIKFIIYLLRQ
jgi:hypothetical protein